jgi:hypothetical protein
VRIFINQDIHGADLAAAITSGTADFVNPESKKAKGIEKREDRSQRAARAAKRALGGRRPGHEQGEDPQLEPKHLPHHGTDTLI